MGMKMPSWFDIYGLSNDSKEDEEGIKKASEYVHGLIDEEISKTDLSSDQILLGKLVCLSLFLVLMLYAN